ncbi:MAG: alpha-glucosidase C-terminal domain-containing protein, partial [Lachnospiraceae bacterium]|nr:alpha-glucosidase C-terminal domain-containing protein [Lachnospiraceae bacterium]
ADRPTVAAQRDDADSLYSEVKRLIACRQDHAALHNDAGIEFLEIENYPLAYVRKSSDEKLLVVLNPSDSVRTLRCSEKPGKAVYTIGGEISSAEAGLSVPPCSAGIYQL